MKKYFVIAATLLFAGVTLFSGCKKEDGQVFRLTVNRDTKTTMGTDYVTNWTNGDGIYINGVEHPLTVNVDGPTATATWEDPEMIDPVNGKYYGFYAGIGTVTGSQITESTQQYSYSLPNEYTVNSKDQLRSPMAGEGNEGRDVVISFSNLSSLLELWVTPAANGSYDITITEADPVNNMPLSGNFTATKGTDGWNVAYVDGGQYSITVHFAAAAGYVYIPLPAGNHKLNITTNYSHAYQSATYNYLTNEVYTIDVLPAYHQDPNHPIIPAPFPIDDNNVALFGKGNLRYNHTANPQWALEANQWDFTHYSKSGNGNNATVNTSSQLSWMYAANVNPLNLSNIGNSNSTYYPGGYGSLIDPDNATKWLVPSRAQWTTIMNLNSTTNARWGYLNLTEGSNTYHGLIIVSDVADIPTSLRNSLGNTYTGWDDSSMPSLTTSDFTDNIENQGVIFLPACGYYTYQGNSGQLTNETQGYYRTSESVGSGATAYIMHFTPTATPDITTTLDLGYGVSVRLVYVENLNSSSK